MTGTRLNDCTPATAEEAKYTISDTEREAQIREQWTSPNWSELSHNYPVPTLLRLLDEARAEIARLRAPPAVDVMTLARNFYANKVVRWLVAYKSTSAVDHQRWFEDMFVQALTAYGDQRAREARQQILVDSTPLREAVAREARAAAITFERECIIVELRSNGYHAAADFLVDISTPPQSEERHLTPGEQRVMHKALLRSTRIIDDPPQSEGGEG
jgi:hypothetical protein